MRELLLLSLLAVAAGGGVSPLAVSAFSSSDSKLHFAFHARDSAVGSYYQDRGVLFYGAKSVRTQWAFSYGAMVANGPPGGWGDAPLSFAFVKPGTFEPATVTRVAFYVAGMSATVKVKFFGAAGVALGEVSVNNGMGRDLSRYHGWTSSSGIHRVEVSGTSFAIDNVRFDVPVSAAGGGGDFHIVGEEPTDGITSVDFDSLGSASSNVALGSHYESRGVRFNADVVTLVSDAALTPAHLASTGAGTFGTTSLGFEFVSGNSNAYVSYVGFYVAGTATRFKVVMFDTAGDRVATYSLLSSSGRDPRRKFGFAGVGIHRVVVSPVSDGGIAIDALRFDAPRAQDNAAVQITNSVGNMGLQYLTASSVAPVGANMDDKFLGQGLFFDNAIAVQAPGSGRAAMVANAAVGDKWGTTALTMRFVLRDTRVPATVTHVGFLLSGPAGHALVTVYDQEGNILSEHREDGLRPTGRSVLAHADVGIAAVRIDATSYAVDDVRFGAPLGFVSGDTRLIAKNAFASTNIDYRTAFNDLSAGEEAHDQYRGRGILFSVGTVALRSKWSYTSKHGNYHSAMMVADASTSFKYGDRPMTISFVKPGTNEPATVETVGFHVVGHSQRVIVQLLDPYHKSLGNFTLPNGGLDARRWYGFQAPHIAYVRITSTSYAIDDVRFNSPVAPRRDCSVSSWGNFSGCSHTCGTGSSTQPWGGWSDCPTSCGSASVKTRRRDLIQVPFLGGKGCPDLLEHRVCGDYPCPADCTVTNFTEWTHCSRSCGGGRRARTREIDEDARSGGRACPVLYEEVDCNVQPCVFDCEVSLWSRWSECSVTCGGDGEHRRTRYVMANADRGGKACPNLKETKTCNLGVCGVNCEMSEWGGTKHRKRFILKKAKHKGAICPETVDKRDCNAHHCPINCEMNQWACKHTTCTFEYNYKAGHNVMAVHATPGETMGKQHHCSFNFGTQRCECRCFGEKQTPKEASVKTRIMSSDWMKDEAASRNPIIEDDGGYHFEKFDKTAVLDM
eukprot:g3831.t1